MEGFEVRSRQKCFGGWLTYASHPAATTGCTMTLSVFEPPNPTGAMVTWLSGLTCTEENFTTKAGAYGTAAELGLTIIAPDTSPRGDTVADDEAYDLGQGAGFYLTATQEPWSAHYRMDQYVVEELPGWISQAVPSVDLGRHGIMGHSMGGHGALTLGLKNPQSFFSLSAFSPIVAPSQCPWGQKAFSAYLGDDRQTWLPYDATELIANIENALERPEILIDVGLSDPFLEEQLMPEKFEQACATAGQSLTLRRHEGYDHSYFFIASFIDDHLRHHAKILS
ncbi:MAG: S-formylglutathione hydrolase [Pseudomonadota bacterium]